jgi:hypothetical protein
MPKWNGFIDLKEEAAKSANIVKTLTVNNGRVTFTAGDDTTSNLDVVNYSGASNNLIKSANTLGSTFSNDNDILLIHNNNDEQVQKISVSDFKTNYSLDHSVGDGGLTQKNFTTTLKTKLDGIEASADVTDTANVEAAGALMDSELSDLAGIKALTVSTKQDVLAEGEFADGDKTKLDGIEVGADVTDLTNVKSALSGKSGISDAGSPAGQDRVLLLDYSDNFNLKYADYSDFGGSGGGLTETPLAMMSGRWQWSSTDEGERIHVGNTAYGPFNYYVFSTEPVAIKGSTNLLRYNSNHVVNTTTAPIYPYYAAAMGVWSPNNGKKIKMKASGRFQGANSGATFGISLWDASDPSNGSSTSTNHTATLRGESNSITVDTTSTKYWTMELTTTNAINDKWALPMIENRTGNWSSNVYFYGQIALYLVD